MLACIAPLTRRTAISIHSADASAVPKKLSARPLKPISSTGRRPKRSDKAPRMGEPMKFAKPNAIATRAYAPTCSDGVLSNDATSLGSTGMIRPIEIMSISTVAMMNGIAAWRPAVRPIADISRRPAARRPPGSLARANPTSRRCRSNFRCEVQGSAGSGFAGPVAERPLGGQRTQ